MTILIHGIADTAYNHMFVPHRFGQRKTRFTKRYGNVIIGLTIKSGDYDFVEVLIEGQNGNTNFSMSSACDTHEKFVDYLEGVYKIMDAGLD